MIFLRTISLTWLSASIHIFSVLITFKFFRRYIFTVIFLFFVLMYVIVVWRIVFYLNHKDDCSDDTVAEIYF